MKQTINTTEINTTAVDTPAVIDTGAYNSAANGKYVENVVTGEVSATLLLGDTEIKLPAHAFMGWKDITVAPGIVERRPSFSVNLTMLGTRKAITLTVADYSHMDAKLIIGRKTLREFNVRVAFGTDKQIPRNVKLKFAYSTNDGIQYISQTAKVDTGIKRSSVHATDIVVTDRFVTAKIGGVDMMGMLVKWVNIRIASNRVERRPVVALPVFVEGETRLMEFSLTDRSKMKTDAVIGRQDLAGYEVKL